MIGNYFVKIIEMLENLGFIGLVLILISFLIGIKFPDWDFKFKIKHRNILTHSPFILFGMIYAYKTHNDVEIFRYVIMGFALGIGIHMIFDFFPKGWNRGALIHLPFVNSSLGVFGSKFFIFLTTIYSLHLAIKFSKIYSEVIILSALGIFTIFKNIRKEKKIIRPITLFIVTFILLGAVKYDEILISISDTIIFMITKGIPFTIENFKKYTSLYL